MDSKAQEQLTAAHDYAAKVDCTIAEMDKTKVLLKGYRSTAVELKNVIGEVVTRFEDLLQKVNAVPQAYRYDLDRNEYLRTLVTVGKGLKNLLDVPVMGESGKVNSVVTVVQESRGLLRLAAGGK